MLLSRLQGQSESRLSIQIQSSSNYTAWHLAHMGLTTTEKAKIGTT
jgi:hypothetical protein